MARFDNDYREGGNNREPEKIKSPYGSLASVINERRTRQKSMYELEFDQRVMCTHQPTDNLDINVERLADVSPSKLDGKSFYNADTTFVCCGEDGCGDIFSMETFKPEKLQEAVYTLHSALQQIKIVVGGNSSSSNEKALQEMQTLASMFPALHGLCKLYEQTVKKVTSEGRNKGRGQKQTSSKGGFGLPSNNQRLY